MCINGSLQETYTFHCTITKASCNSQTLECRLTEAFREIYTFEVFFQNRREGQPEIAIMPKGPRAGVAAKRVAGGRPRSRKRRLRTRPPRKLQPQRKQPVRGSLAERIGQKAQSRRSSRSVCAGSFGVVASHSASNPRGPAVGSSIPGVRARR